MSKGFQDITEALQEECSHLFYTEETGIRDRVFEVRMVGVVWRVLCGGRRWRRKRGRSKIRDLFPLYVKYQMINC